MTWVDIPNLCDYLENNALRFPVQYLDSVGVEISESGELKL